MEAGRAVEVVEREGSVVAEVKAKEEEEATHLCILHALEELQNYHHTNRSPHQRMEHHKSGTAEYSWGWKHSI